MKIPKQAIDEMLSDEEVRRAANALAEARDAAAAAARESAAEQILTSVEVIAAPPESRRRGLSPPSDLKGIADQAFVLLGRPERRGRWEELAAAAAVAGLGELSRALDRMALSSGGADEADARVGVALAAHALRQSSGPGQINLTDARSSLIGSSRARAVAEIASVVLDTTGWLAVDSSGCAIYLADDPASWTLGALVSSVTGYWRCELILGRSEATGAFAVPVWAEPPDGSDRIRLA